MQIIIKKCFVCGKALERVYSSYVCSKDQDNRSHYAIWDDQTIMIRLPDLNVKIYIYNSYIMIWSNGKFFDKLLKKIEISINLTNYTPESFQNLIETLLTFQ